MAKRHNKKAGAPEEEPGARSSSLSTEGSRPCPKERTKSAPGTLVKKERGKVSHPLTLICHTFVDSEIGHGDRLFRLVSVYLPGREQRRLTTRGFLDNIQDFSCV